MLTERGAGIVSVVVPDRNGVMGDVVLGYRDEASYLGDGPSAGMPTASPEAGSAWTANGLTW